MPIFPSSLDDLLFSQRHLGVLIKDQRGRAENSVDQIGDDLLLSTPTEDLVSQIGDEVKIPPLVLDHNSIARSDPRFTNMAVGPGGHPMTVNAHAYDVDFNYTGSSGLFNHQPDTHDNTLPRAKLDSRSYEGTITITAVATDGTAPEEIRRFIDNEVCLIEKYIGFQALQLDPFNSTIHAHVRSYVEARKAKTLRLRNTAASLGFAMQRRQGAPPTYISPVVRQKLPVALKAVEGYQPEPEMHENDYQNVLKIIESMTWVMERSPSTFSKMPEEVLRDHYLVQLNGQYESATSETFNAHGKTDILVRDKGRNIFIAECKIWRGPQSATEALDQLLTYLTWRDTKAALMIFSHNKGFSLVLAKLWEQVEAHPRMKRGPVKDSDTRQKYIFTRADDELREIILTIMAFSIPQDS